MKDIADGLPGSNNNELRRLDNLNERTKDDVDELNDTLYIPPIVSLMIATMVCKSQVFPCTNLLTLIPGI